MSTHRPARIALIGAVAVAALFALAGPASAGILVASASSCDSGANAQPFAQFGDDNQYFTVPGGGFEGGAAGWSLSRARVIGDQEPWQVSGDNGSHALDIAPGGTAVSPAVCVGIDNPSMRFFARRSGGGVLGTASQLLVTARVETSLGVVVDVPVGAISSLTNGTAWSKTPSQIVLASLLPLLPDAHTPIQFRFTPVGTADWVIDDVFVDPHCRG